MFPIPEGLFPVSGTAPVTTNGASTTDFISLKNAQKAWIVCHLKQTVGHATVLAPYRSTVVSGSTTALANTVPIWYGNVSTSTNALTRQTDAVNYTMGGSVTGDVYVIFEIDPANLGSTYDCIGINASNSSQATNFWEVTFWIQPRYSAQTANQLDYLTD